MKQKLYCLFAIAIVSIFSIAIFEVALQVIPLVYKHLPNSQTRMYIYVLGESSSVGEPYNPKISYYKIINYMLDGKIDNKNIEFIVFAKSASKLNVQYWKYFLYRYLHPLRKGLVFIYAGKNDWDNGNNASYDYTYCYKYNIVSLFNDTFLNKEDFKYNYEKLILLAKKFDDNLFISTIAGNYAGFMPHLYITENKYNKEFYEIDNEILINKNYKKALHHLQRLENIKDSDKSWVYYRIGKIYEFLGNAKKANDYFIKGINLYYNLIPSQYQNKIIQNLSKKYDICLIDIFNKLYNSGKIIGFNFYADNQHPNLQVYIMIAELFIDGLSKKYKIDCKRQNITEQELYKYFNFNKYDKYNVYRHSLDVTLVHSKENDNINRYVFEQVDKYLDKIIKLNPYEGKQKDVIISFYTMMIEMLKNNREKAIEIYSKNKKLINKNKYKIGARICDWEEYNEWVSNFLKIEDFFDLRKGRYR